MTKRTFKVAVWNICGPSRGIHSPESAAKINALQRNRTASVDLAFYLEAPEGRCEHLPGVCSETWKRSWWVRAAKAGNPRGILAVQYERCGKDIEITEVPPAGADPDGRTAIGFKVSFGGAEFLRIVGVWTTPRTDSQSQRTYLTTLKSIVGNYRGFLGRNDLDEAKANEVVSVVVGDTNVNIPADGDPAGRSPKAESRRELEEFLAECRLKLVDAGIAGTTLRKTELEYRCDLMMMSPEPQSPERFSRLVSARLGEYGYGDSRSDHKPIIFEISVPGADRGQ